MTGLVLALLLTGPPADVLKVSAQVDAPSQAIGSPAELRIEIEIADGWELAPEAPPPLTQIATNPAIRLDGPEQHSAKTGFLRQPYEEMRESLKRKHKLFFTREPEADDRVAFNVQAYVRKVGTETAYHVRRRVSAPLSGKGETTVSADGPWTWGAAENPLLKIGDTAPAFSLKSANGSTTSLSDFKGKKNVVIAYYRAFW